MPSNNYNDQVFINCPFDGDYLKMFRACTFVILDAGFIPRCSLEVENGTQFRLEAILNLVNECRYGVHDLSRVELDQSSKLPRFNMPFELGIFYSAKHFGNSKQKQKHCLVLEKEKYRYQKFLSDIAGIDVTPHKYVMKTLILETRNWLVTASRRKTIPAGEEINERFTQFNSSMQSLCRKKTIDYDSMPFVELVDNMSDWLRINQSSYAPLFGP